jgi:carbonic anhydrase
MRYMFSTLALALAFLAAPAMAQVDVPEAAEAMTQTAETQAALTPAEALEMLKEGNARFVSGAMLDRDYMAQVAQTAQGQFPFAVVLGCIDSRVPPEIVFDQGIGDLFAPRIAGNFENVDILGSMEFATAVAGSKVVVVLGHTSCGAVKGACDHVELGNLTGTLANIAPAVYAVRDDVPGPHTSANPTFVQAVAEENVERTVVDVLERSPVMAELVEAGDLIVVGAMHDVATGEVTFYDPIDSLSDLDAMGDM